MAEIDGLWKKCGESSWKTNFRFPLTENKRKFAVYDFHIYIYIGTAAYIRYIHIYIQIYVYLSMNIYIFISIYIYIYAAISNGKLQPRQISLILFPFAPNASRSFSVSICL